MAKTVLVVDDSRTVRAQVIAVLAGSGYQALEANDGVEGYETIARHPEIAVVICDVNMPRMSGIDMVAMVKKDVRNAQLPIVMLTTEGQPALIARAKAAGAKGWLVKPFNPSMLLAAVGRLAGG
jgi:two-component system chemotaxis response regulator CheY